MLKEWRSFSRCGLFLYKFLHIAFWVLTATCLGFITLYLLYGIVQYVQSFLNFICYLSWLNRMLMLLNRSVALSSSRQFCRRAKQYMTYRFRFLSSFLNLEQNRWIMCAAHECTVNLYHSSISLLTKSHTSIKYCSMVIVLMARHVAWSRAQLMSISICLGPFHLGDSFIVSRINFNRKLSMLAAEWSVVTIPAMGIGGSPSDVRVSTG